MNIAIDGPAGAGKSTIAKKAAGELGFIYVDTGAMYRAVAVYLTESDISASDEDLVEKSIADISVEIKYEDGAQQVYLNGENVTGKLRTEAAGNMASKASALPCVREKLLSLQRDLAASNDVVMDGRDIGSVVFPHAEVKFFMTASPEVRAQRRYKELIEKGEKVTYEEVEANVRKRDYIDEHRETSPLVKTPDAVLIDNGDMTVEEEVEEMLKIIRSRYESRN